MKPTTPFVASPVLPYYPLLLSAIGVYLAFALYRLSAIPLGYDELLFCNAALGGLDPDLFIFAKIGGIPILLMDYIGALKAWLYYPIFNLFCTSVWSIRLPMVLLTAYTLFLIGEIVRKQWGWQMALFIAFYTAFDASFGFFTKFDTGPNAIELFLKVLTMVFLLRFIATGQIRNIAGIGVMLLLGLFNKLNFIWYVNAFYAGLVLGYGRTIYGMFTRFRGTKKAQLLIGLALPYLLAVVYLLVMNHYYDIFGQKIGNEKGFLEPFNRVFDLFKDIMGSSGLAVYSYHYGFSNWPQWLFKAQPIVATVILLATAGTTLWLLLRNQLAQHRLYVFSVVVLFALLVQLFATERARYGWHIFAVYPFATMAGLYSLHLLWQLLPGPSSVRLLASRLMLACLFVLVVVGQLYTAWGLHRQPLQHGVAINQLIDYARPINKKFVIVGGACTTQLLTMTQQPNKYFEVAYLFGVTHKFLTIHAKDPDEFYQKFLSKPGEYLFIDSTNPLPPGTRVHYRDFDCQPFLDVVKQYNVKVAVAKEILGPSDGYRIYHVVSGL